jgi:hypothetical protein
MDFLFSNYNSNYNKNSLFRPQGKASKEPPNLVEAGDLRSPSSP